MFTPIILGSDKTTVSVATGQTEYYPLYLSLGNLHNSIRQAHSGGVVVIAFLAIPKGTHVSHTKDDFNSSQRLQVTDQLQMTISFEPFAANFSTLVFPLFSNLFAPV